MDEWQEENFPLLLRSENIPGKSSTQTNMKKRIQMILASVIPQSTLSGSPQDNQTKVGFIQSCMKSSMLLNLNTKLKSHTQWSMPLRNPWGRWWKEISLIGRNRKERT